MGMKDEIDAARERMGVIVQQAHVMENATDFLHGLRELAESAFPKRCPACGRIFETAAEFLAQTRPVRADHSGVKPAQDDSGVAMLEIYRNCTCGSTLMDFFSERRDLSEKGLLRRRRFAELHAYLVLQGISGETARTELLKVMRGMPSELLQAIAPPQAGHGPSER
jgi:hypothetical protein